MSAKLKMQSVKAQHDACICFVPNPKILTLHDDIKQKSSSCVRCWNRQMLGLEIMSAVNLYSPNQHIIKESDAVITVLKVALLQSWCLP